MSIREETRRALREIGLTDYETRAYLALLESGPMTASETSRNANLPYSKIYDVLSSLEKKGWIEIESGRPKRYYPKPPSEGLEATKIRIEGTIRSWEDQILEELQPLYERRGTRERPDIWIVRGNFNTIAKIQEALNKTRNSLMLAVPLMPNYLVEMLFPILSHLRSGGVKIKLMISQDVNKSTIQAIVKLAEVRTRDQMFGGGLISDGREVMLLLGEEEGEESIAIWSDHVGLAKLAKEYFEYLWKDAKPMTR